MGRMCVGKDAVRIHSVLSRFHLNSYSVRVVAHVDASMVKPPSERPFEGIITIHSELSPMASSEYESLGRYDSIFVCGMKISDRMPKEGLQMKK